MLKYNYLTFFTGFIAVVLDLKRFACMFDVIFDCCLFCLVLLLLLCCVGNWFEEFFAGYDGWLHLLLLCLVRCWLLIIYWCLVVDMSGLVVCGVLLFVCWLFLMQITFTFCCFVDGLLWLAFSLFGFYDSMFDLLLNWYCRLVLLYCWVVICVYFIWFYIDFLLFV